MKLRVFLSACLMGLTQLALADMPPKPETCPSASALKSQPFFMAQKPEGMPGYGVMSLGKYQTNDNWVFLMGFIDADDVMQALLIGNQNLPHVSGEPEPAALENEQVWICAYEVTGTPYLAFSVTPLKAPGHAAHIMQRLR